ncbi:MAG: hypothetical protein MI863_00615 [Desulfobacterales bacterium]|nr:hypothetical protein [Desulfobacterales bacterium]
MPVDWNDLEEGSMLPELKKQPGITDLVIFSAGNGDFNPLHHDVNSPHAKALGSVLVHGRYKFAVLGQLVSDWMGHSGKIKTISCRYTGMDMPDKPILCKGLVRQKREEDGARFADLDIWTEDEAGTPTTQGKAVVRFD